MISFFFSHQVSFYGLEDLGDVIISAVVHVLEVADGAFSAKAFGFPPTQRRAWVLPPGLGAGLQKELCRCDGCLSWCSELP